MRTLLVISAGLALALSLPACGGGGPSLSRSAERGRAVFLEKSNPKCGTCHVLEHAGTTGIVGPNLDTLKPDRQKVLRSVQQGVGVMPTQKEILTPGEIEDVASYVVEVAGRQ